MTIIEWMAAIIAIGIVIKLLVILVNPKAWLKIAMPLYSNSIILMIVGLILSGGSLWFLLDNGITIVQIFAVMFFLSSLIIVGVAGYSKEIISLGKKILSKGILKRMWLYIIIWLALSVWTIKELFF